MCVYVYEKTHAYALLQSRKHPKIEKIEKKRERTRKTERKKERKKERKCEEEEREKKKERERGLIEHDINGKIDVEEKKLRGTWRGASKRASGPVKRGSFFT